MAKIKVLEMLEATTGGTRRHLNDLVANLDPRRFEVAVLCSTRRDRTFGSDVERMRRAGTKVIIVPMVRAISPVRDFFCLCAITTHLRKNRYDIVHTHSSKAGFLGRLAVRLAHLQCVIHTPHVFSFQMQVRTPARLLFHRLERFAAKYTRAFICLYHAQMEAARTLNLAETTAVFLVPNGISDAAFHLESREQALAYRHALGLAEDEIAIGHVGRFVPQKGQDVLVKAMKTVAQAVPRARLIMLGDGPDLERIRQLIRSTQLDSRCAILPPCEDPRPFYSSMDILALPSRWEGMPYVLLEAMAAVKPVVASSVGGIPEVIENGRNGLLVPPGDATALAAALVRLATDAQLRTDLGSAARNTVHSGFRLAEMIERIERIYVTTLERTRAQC